MSDRKSAPFMVPKIGGKLREEIARSFLIQTQSIYSSHIIPVDKRNVLKSTIVLDALG
jgi:hypothetical protein